MKYRYRAGVLLFLLAIITYIDRVCIVDAESPEPGACE